MEALARHRLSRAREAFSEGEHLLARGALLGAVNRFYYAAFYASRSLLATRQVDSARHSGVISLFQQHFVKTGVIEGEVAKVLPRSFEKRQDTDYGDFATITPEEVGRMQQEVRAFVDECGRVLERLIAAGEAGNPRGLGATEV